MEHIASILVIFSTYIVIQCLPIYNGLTVKFNDISSKEYTRPKTFGALFARISQDEKELVLSQNKTDSNTNIPNSAQMGTGCTNQIGKIIFPVRIPEKVYNISKSNVFINIPIISQPFTGYNILVATAPPNMRLSRGDTQPLVIYIVFPEEKSDDATINIPTIYFVNKLSKDNEKDKKETVDPILIIDSNRIVTGIKSDEVAKYVKFKNVFRRRYNYLIKD